MACCAKSGDITTKRETDGQEEAREGDKPSRYKYPARPPPSVVALHPNGTRLEGRPLANSPTPGRSLGDHNGLQRGLEDYSVAKREEHEEEQKPMRNRCRGDKERRYRCRRSAQASPWNGPVSRDVRITHPLHRTGARKPAWEVSREPLCPRRCAIGHSGRAAHEVCIRTGTV